MDLNYIFSPLTNTDFKVKPVTNEEKTVEPLPDNSEKIEELFEELRSRGLDYCDCPRSLQQAIVEREQLQQQNYQLQHKLAEYFRKKKADESRQDYDKNVTDQEQRYLKYMGKITHIFQANVKIQVFVLFTSIYYETNSTL